MTEFHEGQEVEVRGVDCHGTWDGKPWRKAKIVQLVKWDTRMYPGEWHEVQFHDGTRAVFDVDHIREVFQ